MEPLAGGRRETRAVGTAVPARGMQPERLLERRLELGELARRDRGHLPQLAQLPAAALVEVALLRVRLRAVNLVPAGGDVEDRRLDALDQREPGGERLGDPAAGRQAMEVHDVAVLGSQPRE